MDPAILNAKKMKDHEFEASRQLFMKSYSRGVDQYGSSVKSFGKTKVLKK